MVNIVAVIPARAGSKRFPGKNTFMFRGKPLLVWSIEACLHSKRIGPGRVYVSSEDDGILLIAKTAGAIPLKRPDALARDDVWTQDVIEHAVEEIKRETCEPDIVVRVQANSPQVTCEKIDECVDKLIDRGLWEVFTVATDGVEDAAVHVMRARCVSQRALSVYKGVVMTDYVDVHTLDDLLWLERERFRPLEREILDFMQTRYREHGSYLWNWALNVPLLEERWKRLVTVEKSFCDYALSPDGSKKSVLDLGCGFCMTWPFMLELGFDEFVGVDLYELRNVGDELLTCMAEELVDTFIRSKGAKATLYRADVRNIDGVLDASERFDLVTAQSVNYMKCGSTGIPQALFDGVVSKRLADEGFAVYAG